MSEHGKLLLSTNMFSGLNYTFNGQDLVYHLTPASDLYKVRLANLPLDNNSELDKTLRSRIALYHGKVPADGGVNDSVRQVLEQLLAAEGIKATVQAAVITGAEATAPDVMSYSIIDPAVRLGSIVVGGKPLNELDPLMRKPLTKLLNANFSTDSTLAQLRRIVAEYYSGLTYADATIQVDRQPSGLDANGLVLNYKVSVAPGKSYKLGTITLAPGLLTTQSEFNTHAKLAAEDAADYKHVQANFNWLLMPYHDRGLMAAELDPHPTFDQARGLVSYHVSITPGPVYTMGKLEFGTVSPELRHYFTEAWPMAQGATFKEKMLVQVIAPGDANEAVSRELDRFLINYELNLNPEDLSVDVQLNLTRLP